MCGIVAGDIGTLVAAGAAVIGLPLIYLQVRRTRQATQAETLLPLLMRIQEDELHRSRRALYLMEEEASERELTTKDYERFAPDVEPMLRLIDLVGVMIYSGRIPKEPFAKGPWATMVARSWEAGFPFVEYRRGRDRVGSVLWLAGERLGNEAKKSSEKLQRRIRNGLNPPRGSV